MRSPLVVRLNRNSRQEATKQNQRGSSRPRNALVVIQPHNAIMLLVNGRTHLRQVIDVGERVQFEPDIRPVLLGLVCVTTSPHVAVDVGRDVQAVPHLVPVLDPRVATIELAGQLVGRRFQVSCTLQQPVFTVGVVESASVKSLVIPLYKPVDPIFDTTDDDLYLDLVDARPRASRRTTR